MIFPAGTVLSYDQRGFSRQLLGSIWQFAKGRCVQNLIRSQWQDAFMTDAAVDTQRLTELVRALEQDLVFAMSLGSKELFHSNLLGWFINTFPAVAEAVTGSGRRSWSTGRSSTPTC